VLYPSPPCPRAFSPSFYELEGDQAQINPTTLQTDRQTCPSLWRTWGPRWETVGQTTARQIPSRTPAEPAPHLVEWGENRNRLAAKVHTRPYSPYSTRPTITTALTLSPYAVSL
jgi:hypothetical protein